MLDGLEISAPACTKLSLEVVMVSEHSSGFDVVEEAGYNRSFLLVFLLSSPSDNDAPFPGNSTASIHVRGGSNYAGYDCSVFEHATALRQRSSDRRTGLFI